MCTTHAGTWNSLTAAGHSKPAARVPCPSRRQCPHAQHVPEPLSMSSTSQHTPEPLSMPSTPSARAPLLCSPSRRRMDDRRTRFNSHSLG